MLGGVRKMHLDFFDGLAGVFDQRDLIARLEAPCQRV